MLCKMGLFNNTLSLEWLLVLELQDRRAVSQPELHFGDPAVITSASMWDLWRNMWQRDRLISACFRLPTLPVIPSSLRTHTLTTAGVVETWQVQQVPGRAGRVQWPSGLIAEVRPRCQRAGGVAAVSGLLECEAAASMDLNTGWQIGNVDLRVVECRGVPAVELSRRPQDVPARCTGRRTSSPFLSTTSCTATVTSTVSPAIHAVKLEVVMQSVLLFCFVRGSWTQCRKTLLCKGSNKWFESLNKSTQLGPNLTFQIVGLKWRKIETNIEKFRKDEFRDK